MEPSISLRSAQISSALTSMSPHESSPAVVAKTFQPSRKEKDMAKIDGMIVQTDNSQPHVVFIMETLSKQFPYTIWKIGGYNNRSTSDGSVSAHSSGRACDIYLDAFDPIDKQLGDLLFEMFHANAVVLKVDHVIWDQHIWSQSKGGPTFFTKGNGGPHQDHIHVAFENNNLNIKPWQIVGLCKIVYDKYVVQGDARDREDGLYGKAFPPKKSNTRLTKRQRHQVMLENMGFKGS
jgi:hypothetical protein